MKPTFNNPKGFLDIELEQIEKIIGKTLPFYLRNFYKNHGGANPTINGKPGCLTVTHSDGWVTTNWIESIDSFETLQAHLSNLDYLKELAEHFELNSEYVEPENLFPLCNLTNAAVYVAIKGKHNAKVYVADNGDFGIIYHSNDFDQFWNSLFYCD
jgi:hypothetical protein